MLFPHPIQIQGYPELSLYNDVMQTGFSGNLVSQAIFVFLYDTNL